MPARTHYDTLGISPGASPEEVRRAYRDRARLLHPDVNPAPDAHDRFTELQHAYHVLSDGRRRAAYDRSLHAAPAVGQTGDVGPAPHYSWRNVGGDRSPATPEPTEFDDMFDAFFSERQDPGRGRKRRA